MGQSPAEVVAELEAAAVRRETPCGDGHMVWRQWGSEGPILALLHGGGGSWTHWIRNIPYLARRRRIWAPDLPGLGDSAMPPPPLDFRGVSAAVIQGLEEVLPAGERFDMVGFSFGAHTSQYVADAMGERVRSIVLCTGHILGDIPRLAETLLTRWRDVADPAERAAILRHNLAALMLSDERHADDLAVHVYARDVPRSRIRPGRFLNLRDQTIIPRLKCRVSVIAGDLDPLGKPSVAEQRRMLLERRPDVAFHIIEGAGHWISYEAADRFNPLLEELLDA